MDQESATYFDKIQQCEAAIVRIREAERAGRRDSPEVNSDMTFICDAIGRKLFGAANWIARKLSLDREEVLQVLYERLLRDILSLTYDSLERQFGSYLNTMPKRILRDLRNSNRPGASFSVVEHLDEPVGEDGQSRHEMIEDPNAARHFAEIGKHEALVEAVNQLPPEERHVIVLRLQEVENRDIARQFGVSTATATRMYQRAVARLRSLLEPREE